MNQIEQLKLEAWLLNAVDDWRGVRVKGRGLENLGDGLEGSG
jgi:hypothetical protein